MATWSYWASAQSPSKRIGYLSSPTRESVEPTLQAFLHKLNQFGWIDGRNLHIDYRWAEGDMGRLPQLAADLVQSGVDLIVAPAGSAALAAKNATNDIPVVMIFPNDPVGLGLVQSLARPGGNVTGTTFSPGLGIAGKQLELLREAVPRSERVATLLNPLDPGMASGTAELESAAGKMGIKLQRLEATGPEQFDKAFADMERARADAFIVLAGAFLPWRHALSERVIKSRLPAMFGLREYAEAGGLMAYSVNMKEFVGTAAGYVDKILRGANPAELPVEQATVLTLTLNLKTAKALGLTIPPSVLARADEVIQ
jgi:putative tryptophan/tyrosine transport system substrate-binding protein